MKILEILFISVFLVVTLAIGYQIVQNIKRKIKTYIENNRLNFQKNKNKIPKAKKYIRRDAKTIFYEIKEYGRNYIEKLSLMQLFNRLFTCIGIITILLIQFKMSNWLPKDIMGVLSMLTLATMFFGAIYIIKNGFKSKSIWEVLFYTFLIILALYSMALQALMTMQKNEMVFIVMILIAIFYSLYYFSNVINYNGSRASRIIQVSSIYIFSLLMGSVVFGFYYYYRYTDMYPWVVLNTDNSNIPDVAKALIKIGLAGFYNYPEAELANTASIVQYLWGRLFDLFFLGYIVTVLCGDGITLNSRKEEEVQ